MSMSRVIRGTPRAMTAIPPITKLRPRCLSRTGQLFKRARDALREPYAAAETGLFFVVTNPGDSEILGTSAVFSLRDGEYAEVGTTYIDERLRGVRLQELARSRHTTSGHASIATIERSAAAALARSRARSPA